jgi:hypothetical protein
MWLHRGRKLLADCLKEDFGVLFPHWSGRSGKGPRAGGKAPV